MMDRDLDKPNLAEISLNYRLESRNLGHRHAPHPPQAFQQFVALGAPAFSAFGKSLVADTVSMVARVVACSSKIGSVGNEDRSRHCGTCFLAPPGGGSERVEDVMTLIDLKLAKVNYAIVNTTGTVSR
jgi:hypothetical protein